MHVYRVHLLRSALWQILWEILKSNNNNNKNSNSNNNQPTNDNNMLSVLQNLPTDLEKSERKQISVQKRRQWGLMQGGGGTLQKVEFGLSFDKCLGG